MKKFLFIAIFIFYGNSFAQSNFWGTNIGFSLFNSTVNTKNINLETNEVTKSEKKENSYGFHFLFNYNIPLSGGFYLNLTAGPNLGSKNFSGILVGTGINYQISNRNILNTTVNYHINIKCIACGGNSIFKNHSIFLVSISDLFLISKNFGIELGVQLPFTREYYDESEPQDYDSVSKFNYGITLGISMSIR